MLYQLMNKDEVVATYKEEMRVADYRYTEVERVGTYLPYGFVDINDWIDGRQIAKRRNSIVSHARHACHDRWRERCSAVRRPTGNA